MENGKLILTIVAAIASAVSAFSLKNTKGATNHPLCIRDDDGTCIPVTCYTTVVSQGHACVGLDFVTLYTSMKTSGGVNLMCTRIWNGLRTSIR